jgi:hypothetical protein
VFDETEFLNSAGGNPAGNKCCSNCPPNTAKKEYATIATTASDKQTEMATRILYLAVDFTKHLKLIVKQSNDSNELSQKLLVATETL